MAIIGQDNRTEILDATNLENPLDSVVSVDVVQINDIDIGAGVDSGKGSGILISPNHILTAAHVIENGQAARITIAKDVPSLPSRTTTQFPLSDANANRSNKGALSSDSRYNGNVKNGFDLGLITLSKNESIIDSSNYIGLLAFQDPTDAIGYNVSTAGYPALVRTANLDKSKNAQYVLRDENGNPLITSPKDIRSLGTAGQVLFQSTGTIEEVTSSKRIFKLSDTMDGEVGDSGSGYWTTLENDDPRVLGVASFHEIGAGGVGLDFGKGNFGTLIDTDAYSRIVEKMTNRLGADSGNDLPENAIIGSEENDNIEGSYRRERILGNEGQDTISGGDADDRLEGGADNDVLSGGKDNDRLQGDGGNDFLDGGEGDLDVAIFSDDYTTENYDYVEISGSTFGVEDELFTFEHIGGTYADGKDTLEGIEWAQFGGNSNPDLSGPPRIIPLPLEDGVENTKSVEVSNNSSNLYSYNLPTSASVSLTAPVSMLDGDIDYTLDIDPYDPNSEYNFVYIVDTSASMDAGELQTVKDAYTDLINSHIDSGLTQNSNFGVVQFSTNATSYFNLTPEQAISTIEGLSTSTNQGTVYDGGLIEGLDFLAQSPIDVFNANNIVYFVSGDISNKVSYSPTFFGPPIRRNDYNSYFDEAQRLRDFAEVRAFGFDSAVPLQIDDVDSDDGVMVSSVGDLSTELRRSGLVAEVESVNILLDGEVINTLTPDQLTDSPMGLTYEGSVEDLDVSIDAENIITAEVIFTPESNLATTTVEHTVTAGDGKLTDANGNPIDESDNTSGDEDPFARERNGGDGDDEITLGYADLGANGGAGGDYIIGNNRDNILDGGAGDDTIFAHGGDDTITTNAGTDKVDGGEGIDTVLYSDVTYQGNSNVNLRQAAGTVSYNNIDTLTNVEFLKFSDVRISASTLEITPTIVTDSQINIIEGDSGNSTTQYTLSFDTPAPVDVTFNYTTEDSNAIAGIDYVAISGQITIPAGETTTNIDLEVIGDTEDEGVESFSLNFSALSGATFVNNQTEYSVAVTIENDDEILPLSITGDENNNSITGDILDDFLSGEAGNDTLNGREGNDTIYGGDNDDILYGKPGDDSLLGGDGDDFFSGHNGNDTIYGGDGDDSIKGGRNSDKLYGDVGNDTLIGEAGNDTIEGGFGNDTINGSDGNDKLYGKEGSDILIGARGDDFFSGHDNNDTIQGDVGNDTLNGGLGNDELYGGANSDKLYGEMGDDILIGEDGYDTLQGHEGNDSLVGNTGNDLLNGGTENDTLDGGEGNDRLFGKEGEDSLLGGDGDDFFSGHFGNDTLYGGTGDDALFGGEDSDRLYGELGNDTLNGGENDDTLDGGEGNDQLFGGDGVDIINGGKDSDLVYGELGDDSLTGEQGNDTLIGEEGHDLLRGRMGNDLLNGGIGSDTIEGDEGNDKLYGKEGTDILIGGDGDDYLSGHDDNDTLYGGDGVDTINGGKGDDAIYSGLGDDLLIGESGMDIFVLESHRGTDTIDDFESGVDYLGLSAGLGFGDLSLTNNSAQTATLIADTTNNNELLAIVAGVSATDLTIADFTAI